VASDEAGKRIKDASGSKTPGWIDFARRLNREDKATLEAVSTLVFLRNRPARKDNSLRQEFGRLKPHLVYKFEIADRLADELIPGQSP
jgi:hypothetical protein